MREAVDDDSAGLNAEEQLGEAGPDGERYGRHFAGADPVESFRVRHP